MCLLHALNNLFTRHATREFVRLRQQRPFPRDFLDLARQGIVLQETRNDLFGRQSLRHSHGVLYDFTFGDRIHNVGDAGLFGELIFAILEFATRFERNDAAHKDIRLINHTFALQQVGNIPNSETARNVHHLVLGKGARRFKPLFADK